MRAVVRRLSTMETKMVFSLSAPHTSMYFEEAVDSVVLPGVSGEYGVTAGHSPLVEELKAGVVSVTKENSTDKFFVTGGFAFTDAESTSVSVGDAFKLEDFDAEKVKSAYAQAKAEYDKDESKKVAMDAAKALATALGV